MPINEILAIEWLPYWGKVTAVILLITASIGLFFLKYIVLFLAVRWVGRAAHRASVSYLRARSARTRANRFEQTARAEKVEQPQSKSAKKPQPEIKDAFDPYSILEIPVGASNEEIKRAYKEQLKLYHPDRVQHLGKGLRDVAHERAIYIQRAYEALHGRRSEQEYRYRS